MKTRTRVIEVPYEPASFRMTDVAVTVIGESISDPLTRS
jgi:hypothetical protein